MMISWRVFQWIWEKLARCFLSDILQQARFYLVIYAKKMQHTSITVSWVLGMYKWQHWHSTKY
jgi:hypothetical protein